MYIEPQSPRFTLETTEDGLRAIVPARRNLFVLLFMCVWLVGWAFGELQAIRELLSPSEKTPQLFLMVWLAGWTLGGVFALGTVVWQFAGREVIIVGSADLQHRVEALGVGRTKTYRLSEVKNLRATDYSTNPFINQAAYFPPVTGSGFGPVAFDYGARTMRLAPVLEEAEAKLLVSKLSSRLPRTLIEI
ncbi:MAG: hypothetical protein KIS62_04615 [Ramlibacter sp.]|nr:hypothetical protein [Ramlibacter sp.]